MDPRLVANLAALQTAREAIAEPEETEVALTPEEAKAAENAARLADQERKRRPTPEEAARAWKRRNGQYKGRRSVTIETPEQAIALWWRGVPRPPSDVPRDIGARARRKGQTAEEQIVAKVRQTHELLMPNETLEGAIAAWPLPMPFYDPVAPLCGMEEELLADPRPYEPPPEEPEHAAFPVSDGRLLTGMRRAEDDGLPD